MKGLPLRLANQSSLLARRDKQWRELDLGYDRTGNECRDRWSYRQVENRILALNTTAAITASVTLLANKPTNSQKTKPAYDSCVKSYELYVVNLHQVLMRNLLI